MNRLVSVLNELIGNSCVSLRVRQKLIPRCWGYNPAIRFKARNLSRSVNNVERASIHDSISYSQSQSLLGYACNLVIHVIPEHGMRIKAVSEAGTSARRALKLSVTPKLSISSALHDDRTDSSQNNRYYGS
jgi:hypothetical protein